MAPNFFPYISSLKNGSWLRHLLILLLIFSLQTNASAQLSFMLGGVYQKYASAPKDYPFLIGLNPRVAFDIGQRMQVSVQSNLEYAATWQYKKNLRLEGVSISTFVPMPYIKNGLGVIEFSALYSYFLKGKNYSKAGLYVSGGPGAAFYVAKLSGLGSTHAFADQRTDFQLDARLGAQYNIAIGWLYLEGRLAPTLFGTGLNAGEKRQGPLYGVNVGVRYLLNRHPYCVN